MANVTINGGTMEEQPIERGWEKKRGFFTVRKWRGTEAAAVTLRDSLISSGAYNSVSMREGPVWEVEARADADVDDNNEPDPDDSPVDTWEMSANRVEKDLLSADIAAVNDLDTVDLQVLRAYANGDTTYAYDDFAWIGAGSSNPAGLYKMLKAGVKSVAVLQPVIRHTTTVSDSYVIASALTNVGSILRTSTLIASEAIPASILNNLPADATRTMDGITYTYGWYKGCPTITDTIDGKVQLQQEWEYGLWTPVLYTIL